MFFPIAPFVTESVGLWRWMHVLLWNSMQNHEDFDEWLGLNRILSCCRRCVPAGVDFGKEQFAKPPVVSSYSRCSSQSRCSSACSSAFDSRAAALPTRFPNRVASIVAL